METGNNYYDILGGYLRQGQPQKAERAANWGIAIGLQAVDGLTPSDYLVDVARRNIEGEITIDEVKQLLKSYYDSKTARTPDDDEKEEADKVSSNIQELLSHRTLTFNVVGVIGTHKAIFNGVFKHAGKIRDYNISKKRVCA